MPRRAVKKAEPKAKCPICGAVAEAGCLYGSDDRPPTWFPGPASFTKNLKASVHSGQAIGSSGFLTGHYTEGIRCRPCQRIILTVPSKLVAPR